MRAELQYCSYAVQAIKCIIRQYITNCIIIRQQDDIFRELCFAQKRRFLAAQHQLRLQQAGKAQLGGKVMLFLRLYQHRDARAAAPLQKPPQHLELVAILHPADQQAFAILLY